MDTSSSFSRIYLAFRWCFCFAKRNGKRIGIEFEVYSSNFFDHKHQLHPNIPRCNMIICWENNLEPVINVKDKNGKIHQIEILELSKIIKEKKLKIFLKSRPPTPSWDKETFLKELNKKVGKGDTYNWVEALIQYYENYKHVFVMAYRKGKRHATLGFHVRKWLSEGVGVPTPILFSDDGSVAFDCKDMPPHIEKELRSRIALIRTKKWVRWCNIPIRDENTFKILKETIQWLAETISAKAQMPVQK